MPFPPPFAEIMLARQAPRPSLASVLASLAGVVGFVGLSLAGAYARSEQGLLTVTAIIWFLGAGVLRIFLGLREPPPSAPRDTASSLEGRPRDVGLG